jgi:toxin FitB
LNYILDTNVISELVAPQPNPNMLHWLEELDPDQVFLSVIVIGELQKGITKLPDSKRKQDLELWFHEDLLVRFREHLLPIDTETMSVWGVLLAELETSGRPMSAIDSLLAASVRRHQFTLVTRNTTHFENARILLFNPWKK